MKRYNTYDFNPETSFVPMQHCCEAPDMIIDSDSIKDALDLQVKEIVDNIKNKIDEDINELKSKAKKIKHDTEEIKEKIERIPDKHHLHEDLEKINKNLHNTKERIIHEIEKHAIDDMCFCHLATKKDIEQAVESINSHTDEKVDTKFQDFETNFFEQFGNLNDQLTKE